MFNPFSYQPAVLHRTQTAPLHAARADSAISTSNKQGRLS